MKKILLAILSISLLNLSNPIIDNIEITNLNNLEKETIIDLLPIKVGQEYSNKVLSDTFLSLVKSKLIYNANIFPKQNGENVSLEIVIDEMPEANKILQNIQYIEELKKKTEFKIKSVNIKGTNIDLSEILKNSKLKEGEYFTNYDAILLRDLIMFSGYFSNVEVLLNRDAENKTIDLIYEVKEYPKINSIKIEGSTLFKNEQELISLSGLKVGDTINTKLLDPQTSPILRLYAESGYMWASFSDVSVNENGDIYIKLNEGKISNVIFEKKNNSNDEKRIEKSDYKIKTKDYVLKRNTYINKGDILNQRTLELTLRELFRTGLFTSLVPEIYKDPSNPDEFIVKIVLNERPTTSISANISYSTEDGLSGSLKLADTNFLGNEQNFDLGIESSLKGNYNFNLSFKDPWIKGTNGLLAGGSIYFKKNTLRIKDLKNYEELKKQVLENGKSSSQNGKEKTKEEIEKEIANLALDKPTDRQYIFGINAQIGKKLTKDISLNSTAKLINVYSKNKGTDKNAQVYQDYTLTSLGGDLIYDTRDDRAIPKKGIYFDLYLEGGYIFRENSLKFNDKQPVKKNGASNGKSEYEKLKKRAYFTTTGDLRAYHPIYKDKNSMAYRLLANYSHKNTPANQMMTVGDGLTLRGLQAPISQNEYAVVFSIENRTYINNYLQAVIFYDGGMASNLIDKSSKKKKKKKKKKN